MRLGKLRHESKYIAIQHFYEKKGWSINWMCRKLEISRAAYYKWLHRTVPEQEKENIELAGLIKDYDERFGHILGYRRMTSWINYFNHTTYTVKRVHRIMKKLGIHAVIRKKRKYHSSSKENAAENILKRDFYADAPNQKWTTDVTEFKIPGEKKKRLYLSAILDLYDRSIVSYVVSSRNNNKLVFDTFDAAIRKNPDAKPIFHSDRGFQYTHKAFRQKLDDQGMIQSMSRVGHCIDNGPTEGLWGIIKTEMYCLNEVHDEATLKAAIGNYIEFYNNDRPQERFDCKTPGQIRKAALSATTPVQYPIPENKRIKNYKEKWAAKKLPYSFSA